MDKLKWNDTDEIAYRLIDQYPQVDPLSVRFTDLHKYVTNLPGFVDNPKQSTERILEAIQMRWYEERMEMEDELGPIQAAGNDEDLDEDDYRDDVMVEDEEDDGILDSDDDDDEEDEFAEGFQEEDEDDLEN